MNEYWKIEKRWLQEWELTPTECLVLADMLAYRCSIGERALRFCTTRQNVYKIVNKLRQKLSTNGDNACQQIATFLSTNGDKIEKEKRKAPPTPPIKEKIKREENREECENTHTREADVFFSPPDPTGEFSETQQVPPPPTPSPYDLLTVEKLTEEAINEVRNGSRWIDALCIRHKCTAVDIEDALTMFAQKLIADGADRKIRSDYKRHFNNWLTIELDKQKNGRNNRQQGVTDDFIRRTAAELAANGGLAF